MTTRLTSSQEYSNSGFAADWVGICAPSDKVGNCHTAPQPLQPWFDSTCPSHHMFAWFVVTPKDKAAPQTVARHVYHRHPTSMRKKRILRQILT